MKSNAISKRLGLPSVFLLPWPGLSANPLEVPGLRQWAFGVDQIDEAAALEALADHRCLGLRGSAVVEIESAQPAATSVVQDPRDP